MTTRTHILAFTFIESIATMLLQRGFYFYTKEELAFGQSAQLTLALVYGLTYIVGAALSHNVSKRFGEKPLLIAMVITQAVLHTSMALLPVRWLLIGGYLATAALIGMMWPIVESYVNAGLTPRQTQRMIGVFNIVWATAVPVGVAASGPLIGSGNPTLFFWAMLPMHAVSLLLCRPLLRRPVHLAADHPERPDTATLARYRSLMLSSRWTMLLCYMLLSVLVPLMPGIFVRLGLGLSSASSSEALLDVLRAAAFVALAAWAGWHGRASLLAVAIVLLPVSFFMVLFGQSIAMVLAGEAVFGLVMGLAYYSALYYAMVAKNAAVEAGGWHESIIGIGFALGPAAALVGVAVGPSVGGYERGMLLGVGPVILVGAIGAALPLLRRA